MGSRFALIMALGLVLVACDSSTADDDSARDDDVGDDDVGDDDASDDDTGGDDDVSDDDTVGDDDTAPPVEDASEVVSAIFPTEIPCGTTAVASVEMRNTGTATWTEAEGYRLGTVDDEDPLHPHAGRLVLPDDVSVAPGETYLFTIELTAPVEEGDFLTDWQMVHELVCWFGEVASETVSVPCPVQTFTDPLTDASVQTGFDDKVVTGGSFSAAGWQTTGSSDRLRLRLTSPIHGDGSLEVDVSNFDPVTQYANDKHQIINMYTTELATQGVFSTDEAWWNIRTGTNYSTGFKFLAAPNGGDSREEVRLIESATWDPADVHTFRVEWDAVEIHVYLDGAHLDTLAFDGRVQPLQYVFVGKDNVYLGQVGPIYSNLRVTYEP
jgi:hypothetical protein